ncbi:arylsulfotransferase family protein [Streptomyces sp. bgisy100]|uniref:arylsulfotransferase family protein n=1 Tax=Streptomyces sp. bgisy100 TaxID=3413783 RepID=UPI003D70F5B4
MRGPVTGASRRRRLPSPGQQLERCRRKSDFAFGPDADFSWQHDARFAPGGRISLFDDGCCNQPDGTPEQESHGLVLDLDVDRRRADVLPPATAVLGVPGEHPVPGQRQQVHRMGPELVLLGIRRRGQRAGRRLGEPPLRRGVAGFEHLVPGLPEHLGRQAPLSAECGGEDRRREQRRLRLLERFDADHSVAGARGTGPRIPGGGRATRPADRIRDGGPDGRSGTVLPGPGVGRQGRRLKSSAVVTLPR